ncbi:MAG: nucleotidyltransferase, partial [Marinilabiliales bacterium]
FVVNNLINANQAKVKVLTSESSWFGVTYKEDKEDTINRVKLLVEEGQYPSKLW